MIDYIDDCFSLIEFPDDDFIEYQRKNFFNIDNLFIFNDNHKITRMSKPNLDCPYLSLFSNYYLWACNIQSMRYDLEISLMLLLYYFKKGIPEYDREIDKVYSSYDWSKTDIDFDKNNPSNVEQYKKLFNTFSNYFIHSLITFINNIENQIVYIFNFDNDRIFSFKHKFKLDDIKSFSKEIKQELKVFIDEFKDFLYVSKFKELRDFRNTMVHKNNPFIFKINTEIFQLNNTYVVSSITDEKSSSELVNNIKESLLLLTDQCKKFDNIVNKYFSLLQQ